MIVCVTDQLDTHDYGSHYILNTIKISEHKDKGVKFYSPSRTFHVSNSPNSFKAIVQCVLKPAREYFSINGWLYYLKKPSSQNTDENKNFCML